MVFISPSCSSKTISSPTNAELKIETSLRSNPMRARYNASVMASRTVRDVRLCERDILGGLGGHRIRQVPVVFIRIEFVSLLLWYYMTVDGYDIYT